MFCQNGKLIQAVVRRRTAVENGQMSRGVVEGIDKPLRGALGKLTKRLKFHGPVNAQFLVTGEGPKLIDVNPRFSGGYPLTHAAGADFVALLHGLVTGRRLPAKQRPVRLGTRATSFVDYVFGEGEV
jgi:carbamoyl-phosphate synthase large subunit